MVAIATGQARRPLRRRKSRDRKPGWLLAFFFESRAAVLVSFGSLMVQRDQWDTSWGAIKLISCFAVRRRTRPQGGRAGLILSIPAQEVSLGSLRVGTIHVQAPTPHTPPLQSFLVDFSQQTTRFSHLLAVVCFQSSPRALDCRIDGVCGTGDYPPPDLPRETSRSRSASEKSK